MWYIIIECSCGRLCSYSLPAVSQEAVTFLPPIEGESPSFFAQQGRFGASVFLSAGLQRPACDTKKPQNLRFFFGFFAKTPEMWYIISECSCGRLCSYSLPAVSFEAVTFLPPNEGESPSILLNGGAEALPFYVFRFCLCYNITEIFG